MNKEVQQKAEAEEKLQELSAEVRKVSAEANTVLAQARGAIGEGATPEALAEAARVLQPQVAALGEMARKVTQVQRTVAGDSAKPFEELSNQLQGLQATVNEEHTNARNAGLKAEQDKKTQEEVARDSLIYEEMIPQATEKTNTAEDMVEKTIITSDMIQACGEDVEMVRQAIEETEKSSKVAQAAIGEARIYLNAKLASTRRLTKTVKERASAEIGKLQQQLQEAQSRLNPLKNVKADWEKRKAAQALVAEVEEKIVLAEVDVDRAEELVSLLQSDTPNKEALQSAHRALQVAEEHVNSAMRTYQTKKKASAGMAVDELAKLEPRGDAALKRIRSFRTALKEVGERVTTDGYVDGASEKVQAVTDALAKLEEIEGRFQDSDSISLEEVLQAVKSSEGAAGAAQTASSMARMFIQMKVLEVKRFSSGPSQDATQKLQLYMQNLEVATARLAELKAGIAKRRHVVLVREAEERVTNAEQSVERMSEAAAIFADDERLMAMSSEEIREASERTAVCEKEANQALMEVRKFVTARQIEAKSKDASVEVSAELIKFQTRLSTAQAEVGKQRKLFTSVEQRLAVKRLIDEAEKKLAAAEEKAAGAHAAVAGLEEFLLDRGEGDTKEDSADKAVKDAEICVQEAKLAVRTTERHFEAQSRTQGYAKEALLKLEPRMKEAKERSEAAALLVKERSEQIFTKGIVGDAQRRVAGCEEHLRRAAEAELPLREGGGDEDAAKVAERVAEVEKAVQAAQALASGAKTFIAMKRLAVKRLSESVSQAANEELTKLQGAIEEASRKLAEMRSRGLEAKKNMMRRVAARHG